MVTISKPLSAAQAQAYHRLEFTSETAIYYKQGDAVQGEWQGQLAEKFGLSGAVKDELFARLSEGKDPQTEAQMVKHRPAQEYKNADGSTTKAVEHRAGYVAISRAADDARIYTNDAAALGARLATDVSKTAAVEFRPPSSAAQLAQATDLLRKNETVAGVDLLERQGRIREYADPEHRLAAVVREFSAQPGKTVIVAPDRAERQELTQLLRAELRSSGALAPEDRSLWVATMRPEARFTAANYQREDLITFKKGIEGHGISDGAAGIVTGVDARRNLLTVQKSDGEEISYNPARFRAETMKTTVQRDERRDFAEGERIRFSAADKALGVRSGDLGTIERIAGDRAIAVRLDNGKTVDLDPKTPRHIDYGYAVDGSKAVSADRVLVSVATAPQLTGESKIFEALSAARQDAAIYTADASTLSRAPVLPPPRPSTELEQLRQAVSTLGRNETAQHSSPRVSSRRENTP